MNLLTKFNLILFVAFGVAAIAISTIAYFFLVDNARDQVLQEARLMMASATSVRDYTADDISPLLAKDPESSQRFLPETVPAHAATTIFDALRKTYPDYTYREATLNPTNLADRATDWESDVIQTLRNDPSLGQVVGERDGASGRELYFAKPIVATGQCLQCHSTPQAAPAVMLAKYGSNNGFGWHLNETVGAQIVAVPESVPLSIAEDAYRRLLLYLGLGLILSILVLDVGVYLLVVRPLKLVSEAADRVSQGDPTAPDIKAEGKDEIAVVTSSFNRMRTSLAKAFKMLDES